MKKSFLILGLIAIMATVNAQEIRWMTFEDAVAAAKKSPKKIFIDVYTDWCGWCKRMDQTTFQNHVIAKYINENFYPVKLNAETTDTIHFNGHSFVYQASPNGRGGANELAVALLQGRMSYPSYVIMDEQQRLVQKIPGYQNAENFEPILHYFAEDAFKTTEWEKFIDGFESQMKQ